jgi:hypothetical protein
MKLAFYRALAAAIFALAPNVAQADGLSNSTINAAITLQGQDDNGFYTVDVFTGAINVGSGFNSTYSFFRQDTFGGFSTASNQLTGTVSLSIAADSITLTINGQAQPVELIGLYRSCRYDLFGYGDGLGVFEWRLRAASQQLHRNLIDYERLLFGFPARYEHYPD